MKILEDYKKIARELLFEVDDEKIIKYKDEDGESKEMKAGSAKTMPDEHPAKQAYNKMKDDGGDDKEKPSGQKISGSDFDRDGGDDEFGGEDSEVAKYLKSLQGKEDDEDDIDRGKSYGGRISGDDDDHSAMEKEYDVKIPGGTMEPNEDGEDDTAEEIADALAKKFDISREYAMMRAKEETDSGKTYLDFVQDLEFDFESMSDEGGQQRYDEPMFDDGDDSEDDEDEQNQKDADDWASKMFGAEKDKVLNREVKKSKKPFLKEQLERIGGGKY